MSQLTVDQALQLALQHQHDNQLAEAEEIFRQILDAYPDQADTLHLLGALYYQAKRSDLAEARVRQAIKIRNEPAFGLTLGLILQSTQRIEEALRVYQDITARNPDFVDAHIHMGVGLSALSRFEEAAKAFQAAVALSPANLQAQGNLGIVLCHLQRFDEAMWLLRAAIAQAPRNADFHASLAAALYGSGQIESALIETKQAVALNPQHVQAQNLLAMVLRETGRISEALEPAQRAAIMMPESVELQINYAECLRHTGKLDEAAAHYRTCLARHRHIDFHNNYGNVLKDLGLLDESIAEYRKGLALDMQPHVYSNLLYTALYHPGWTPDMLYREMKNLDDTCFKSLRDPAPHTNDRDPNRRLRIGYIATEFKQHAAGLHILPLLQKHDKTQFEVFCYVNIDRPDFFTYRIRQCADHWQSTARKTHAQIADMVRKDQIDILIDLNQHMGGNNLPVYARKPAPIQISIGTGYPGTTGLSAIDYRITDVHLEPPTAPPQPASDVPLRLSATSWCFHPVLEVEINPLPALTNKFITFGNLNNFCKLNTQVYDVWAQVLKRVPHSKLLLLVPEGSSRQRLKNYFSSIGIDPARLIFSPRKPTNEYLKLYHQIDIVLDSFPYDGHQTNLDALWMGVPPIGAQWPWIHSRAVVTQAMCLDLPELVGKDNAGFVEAAVSLASDLPKLSTLRQTLRDKMKKSPLMDDARYAREIEAHFRAVWQKWCAAGV